MKTVRLSTPQMNCSDIISSLMEENSLELYEAVLSSVPLSFVPIQFFADKAIRKLRKIDSNVSHDNVSHVIAIASHLVEAGLIQRKTTTIVEGDSNRITSNVIEYKKISVFPDKIEPEG